MKENLNIKNGKYNLLKKKFFNSQFYNYELFLCDNFNF